MKTIKDVKIGDTVENKANGNGIVTNKTKRTVTVTFKNGNVVKKNYPNSDSYFFQAYF